MFDIGFPELIMIMVIALLVFGPGKMAEIGRDLGKGLRDFRRATADVQKEFNEALKLDEDEKPSQAAWKPSPLPDSVTPIAAGEAIPGPSVMEIAAGVASGASMAAAEPSADLLPEPDRGGLPSATAEAKETEGMIAEPVAPPAPEPALPAITSEQEPDLRVNAEPALASVATAAALIPEGEMAGAAAAGAEPPVEPPQADDTRPLTC